MQEQLRPTRIRITTALWGITLMATLATLATLAPSSAHAQNDNSADSTSGKGKEKLDPCDASLVPTQALARATFSLQRAMRAIQAQKAGTSDLKDAIRALTTPAKDKNERGDSLGRAYFLGQAYILMLQEPNVKPIGRRGDYGIATDTVLSIDLLAAADSAFRKVEAGLPACAVETAKWRQQKPWLDALNGAIAAANEGHLDTAEVLAKRALLIDRTAPYAYSILANAANSRKDYATATTLLKQALAAAEKDTAYNDARISALFDLANTTTLRAEAATGAEKQQLVPEAIAAWQTFIPLGGRDPLVANALQSIVRLSKAFGDSSKISDAYAQVLANPSKFGEQTLLNAGVIATRARKPQDAAKFFAAVLEQNPNQRDALNNLAASYIGTKEPEKVFPLVDRLVALDPNNAENWMLYAYAYTSLLKETKDPKLVKAYTDSLTKYNTKAEKLTPRVALSEFSHTQQSATLGGTVENQSPVEKSYTMTIEFLDKTGAVLDTKTVEVGPIPPKESAPFTATTNVANVVAFRYKPLM